MELHTPKVTQVFGCLGHWAGVTRKEVPARALPLPPACAEAARRQNKLQLWEDQSLANLVEVDIPGFERSLGETLEELR